MAHNQKPNILIVTHSDFGEGLLRAAEMIVGRQEGIKVLSLFEGESLDSFRDKVREALADLDGEVLVMLDLFGGTPANAAALNLQEREFECVSGVNLPMLLEVLLNRDRMTAPELADLALKSGTAGIADVRKMVEERMKKG